MNRYPAYVDLGPLFGAAGAVKLPGSKSISNRILLLAALSDGETEIIGLLQSEDTQRMLDALEKLGVDVTRADQSGTRRIAGCGGAFPSKKAELFLGNAGTALRPLTAVLALAGGHYTLSGVARMHERPIGDLVQALRTIGADICYSAREGFPPVEIRPSSIRSVEALRVRGDVSSQFLTALLIALPLTGKRAVVEVVGEL
ncbi:MAG: 3-phosphoshikimate 1-carboxyvinyltransferase, partial [Burkholderiales bacterium]